MVVLAVEALTPVPLFEIRNWSRATAVPPPVLDVLTPSFVFPEKLQSKAKAVAPLLKEIPNAQLNTRTSLSWAFTPLEPDAGETAMPVPPMFLTVVLLTLRR